MRPLSLVLYGMGLQAMIAGTMSWFKWIVLSPEQQFSAAILFLVLSTVILFVSHLRRVNSSLL